jgi:Family of unknown function (DUF6279)
MRRAAAVLLLALLCGCSTIEFAYNNADTWLRWQAGRYVVLEGDQVQEFDRRLASFLAWHRAEALPQYARLAAEAGARLERGATREDMEWGYDALSQQAREGLQRAAGEFGELLERLSPAQIAQIERRFAEENRKFAREWLEGTPEARRARRHERLTGLLQDWLGDLDDAQREQVRRYSESAPLSGERRDLERRRRQAELVALLHAGESAHWLGAWALGWERARGADGFLDMLADLERSLNPRQRAHVIARLRGYGRNFHVLAAAR